MIRIETVNERWKAAREALKLKQSDIAEALGISQGSASLYEKNGTVPLSSIKAFAAICGVRESYLLNGDFPITEPQGRTPVERICTELGLPAICEVALNEWALLPDAQRQAVIAYGERVLERYLSQRADDPTE